MNLCIKKYIIVCVLLVSTATGLWSQEAYTYINKTLRTRSWGDYPIVLSNEVKGGIHHIMELPGNNLALVNDSVPVARRQVGMLCVVGGITWNTNEDTVLMWNGSTWNQINFIRVWESGDDYYAGQVVFEAGQIYVANKDIPNSASSPSASPADWYDLQTKLSEIRVTDDGVTSSTTLWSSQQITDFINTQLGDSIPDGGEGLTYNTVGAANQYDVNVDDATLEIASDVVQVKDLGIDNAKLAADAVTSDKIALNTIVADDIATDAVTSVEIATDAVGFLEIQTGAVRTAEIENGSILTEDIADDQITGQKLTDGVAGFGLLFTASKANLRVGEGDGIDVTEDAVAIAHGAANQVLTTNATGTAVAWVDQSTLTPDLELTDGHIYVGNTSGLAADVAMSGDAKISNTGVLDLENLAVETSEIANSAVTSAKIADGTIVAADLANTTVTAGIYGSATTVPRITVNPQGQVTGVVNTTITGASPVGSALNAGQIWVGNNSNVAAAVSMSGDVLMNAAGLTTIQANAITYTKMADNAIGNAEMRDDAIGSAEIINNSITADDIGTGAVRSDEILDGTVATVDLADNAVTSNKIALNTIIADDIAADAVGASELADNSVASANIIDGAIATVDIADNAVTVAKIADGAANQVLTTDGTGNPQWVAQTSLGATTLGGLTNVTNDDATSGNILIANGTNWSSQNVEGDATISNIGTVDLTNGAVENSELAANAVTTDKIADGTIIAGDIANGAVTTDKILDGTIAAVDIATGAVTTNKILDGTVATVDIANTAVTTAKIAPGTVVGQVLTTNSALAVEWKAFSLNSTHVMVVSTNNYTLKSPEDEGVVLIPDGITTVYLKATPVEGTMYSIKNIGSSRVTINGNGNTIDGDASIVLAEMYQSVTIVYTSTNGWVIIDRQAKNSLYLGNPGTTGSWRIKIVSGTNELRFEQWNGTAWIYKLEVEP